MMQMKPGFAANTGNGDFRRYVLVCALIAAACLAFKLPSLTFHRQEYDERIYWQLTENWLETGHYNIQGRPVLDELPASIYDRPLFHHPPLASLLLIPFVTFESPNGAILVSWLGHVLGIVGIAVICWTWRRRNWHATHLGLYLPVLAMAMDPVFTFCGRKLWPDNLVGGLAALGVGLCCLAAHRRSVPWAIGAGLAFGAAGSAKLPGLLVLPVGLLVLAWARDVRLGRRVGMMFAAAVPAALLVTPWLVEFYGHYGSLVPTWIRPDEALRAASSHVDREMRRPWHYYLSQSAVVSPIVLVLLIGTLRRSRLIFTRKLAIPLFWFFSILAALLILRASGHGMQMRYLTPAIPAFYAMLAGLLGRAHPRRSLLAFGALLAIFYGMVAMGFYLVQGLPYDDIVSIPELLYRQWSELLYQRWWGGPS